MTNFDGIREKVFLDRYALKDKEGALIEHTPEEMWRRVARGIAANEKKKDQKQWESAFYEVMQDFKFVPAGRILSGAGTEYQVTYFNCFVIPSPKDSRHGILEALGQLVEIQARSGGVGLNLSSLRPKGAWRGRSRPPSWCRSRNRRSWPAPRPSAVHPGRGRGC